MGCFTDYHHEFLMLRKWMSRVGMLIMALKNSIFAVNRSIQKRRFITIKSAHCLSEWVIQMHGRGYLVGRTDVVGCRCRGDTRTKKSSSNICITLLTHSEGGVCVCVWATIEILAAKLLTFLAFVVQVCFYPSLRVNNELFGWHFLGI